MGGDLNCGVCSPTHVGETHCVGMNDAVFEQKAEYCHGSDGPAIGTTIVANSEVCPSQPSKEASHRRCAKRLILIVHLSHNLTCFLLFMIPPPASIQSSIIFMSRIYRWEKHEITGPVSSGQDEGDDG